MKYHHRYTTIDEFRTAMQADLLESHQHINEQAAECRALSHHAGSSQTILTSFSNGAASILAHTITSYTQLKHLWDSRIVTLKEFTSTQNITRMPRSTDKEETYGLLFWAWIIEGLTTAALFISDGYTGIATGCMIGLSLAAINLIFSTLLGFFPCRYINYRISCVPANPRDQYIRLLAWAGLIIGLCFLCILHLAAARTRVLGSHEDLFSVETVSLMNTFANYDGLALVTLGIAASSLGLYKGFGQLSDPIPSYSQIHHDATTAIIKAADQTLQEALNSIEDGYADACDALHDLHEEREDARLAVLEINADIEAHNHHVTNKINEAIDFTTRQQKKREFVTGKPASPTSLDVSALEALKLEPLTITEINDTPLAEQLAVLDAAFNAARSAVRDAHAEFLASGSDFTFHD